jgi:hypothetical protein
MCTVLTWANVIAGADSIDEFGSSLLRVRIDRVTGLGSSLESRLSAGDTIIAMAAFPQGGTPGAGTSLLADIRERRFPGANAFRFELRPPRSVQVAP